mgnify:CR=1 FL=1
MENNIFKSHYAAALNLGIPNISYVLAPYLKDNMPEEYTVSSQNQRHKVKRRKFHLCTLDLPRNAVIIVNGVEQAGPEMVFLQLANDLHIQDLILLGMQMCSHKVGESLRAVTNTKKLAKFLNKTKWHRGHRKAMRALKYIKDGAANIEESFVYMRICLPHALGGYGFRDPVLNAQIEVKNKANTVVKEKNFYPDFYFKYVKTGIEYDSFQTHSDAKSQSKDAVRANVLAMQGVKTISLKTEQFYNTDEFKDFILVHAPLFKRRIQIRCKKFDDMYDRLHSRLPRRSNQVPKKRVS